jgi:3'-5' exoribonuclease
MSDPKTIEQLKTLNRTPHIEGTFRIANCEYKAFAQKPGFFLQCQLSDKTGEMKGVVWDGAEALKTWLKNKMVVTVKGELSRFNDQPQIVIKTLVEQKNFNLADLIPSLDEGIIDILERDLFLHQAEIHNPECLKVWEVFMSDYRKDFILCPGGVGQVHHNYLGGLLEHSTSMMTVAEHYCKVNSHLEHDIIVTGCLLHDIGKIKAYSYSVMIEMTDTGRLLHHIPLGLHILSDICRKAGLDEDSHTVLKLRHIIASHHEIEGNIKPMTPEALAVSAIDGLDAIVNHAVNYMADPEKQKDGNWTAFCNLTQRFYYKPQEKPEVIPMPEKTADPDKPVDLDTLFEKG